MFYDKLKLLCERRGTTITAVAREIGLSTASGTNWKEGKTPRADTLQKLADYFSVKTDFFLSDTDEFTSRPLTDNEVSVLRIFETLDEAAQKKAIGHLECMAMEHYQDYMLLAIELESKGFLPEDVKKIIFASEIGTEKRPGNA